jgi:anti-sigma-K factor RskA
MDVHELTPAYALDALDADETRAYEEHLSRCERCRSELATLRESAAALAWAVEAPPPPEGLRARILDAAAAERANVVPLPVRRPWIFRATAAAAAVAACAAIGLGVWASTRNGTNARALSVVLVVGGDRQATLKVSGLPPAPAGKTYEAWIVPHGASAQPAGLFHGGAATTLVRLRGSVPPNATVAVTVERAGGARAPTGAPVLSAQA